ncbi:MAG TPA: DnaT-like ssDNA-binding domain-containing protein [Buchnera sp. (in: enterobacteria)]|nr:DnaT-like ssDNA-binding domain-containing protein [Buchnera sp. (in: enterobacteria)]
MNNKNKIENISLNDFLKNPIEKIKKSQKKILALLNNNLPIAYLIKPELLKRFLAIETAYKETKSNINLLKSLFLKKNKDRENKIKENQCGKFLMYESWNPDKDFLNKSALWGIDLNEYPKKSELALFISYWKAEGRMFHHIQWQQKLARSLQQSRYLNFKKTIKTDINELSNPDLITPEGFRGK